MKIQFDTRTIAKHLASSVLGIGIGTVVTKTADNHTNLKKDGYPVQIVGGLLAFVICTQFQPVTDKIVDSTFDFVAAKRQARKDKKSDTK